MPQRLRAILFLLIFPPFFAESIASTNTPWYMFLNPLILILMILLYGTAALLLRELWVMKKLGFGRFILYGSIFAGLNEGIVANTWFKSNPLHFTNSEVSRAGGTNWHLVINLVIFHTLFSMLIPILLNFIIFPKLINVRLLKRRGLLICIGLLLFIAIANLVPKNNLPIADAGHRALLFIILISASIVGIIARHHKTSFRVQKNCTPNLLLFAGISFEVLFIISYFVLPKLLSGWSLPLSFVLYLAGLMLAYRLTADISHNLHRTIPLIGGLILPSLLLSFSKINIMQPIIVALFLTYLWFLYKMPKNLGSTPTD